MSLRKLCRVSREKYHPLIHRLHRRHHISRKTLFYVKEYGARSNAVATIMKESTRILVFAALVSSLGGVALEGAKPLLLSFTPLLILLPVLNDMVGDYGTVISSKFSAMLFEGRVRGAWFRDRALRKLFAQVLVVAALTAVISSVLSVALTVFLGQSVSRGEAFRVLLIAMTDVVLLVAVLFILAIAAGLHYYKKGEDPNNFLIPITTSIADFANMIALAALVVIFF